MRVEYAVEFRGIGKIYPGSEKKANANISLGARRAEILCVAGENGAGKTTLMKILGGLEKPSYGEIFIGGKAVSPGSPQEARAAGVGMVHQHFMLFPDYTVAENIVMGAEPRKWGLFFDRAEAEAQAARIIAECRFSISPRATVKSLSVGEMQQVEICRLLFQRAEIVILDEPSAVLAENEIAALFSTMRALAAAGRTIFLITHKLGEIKRVADRVAVLRQGRLLGVLDARLADEYAISKMMFGAEPASLAPPPLAAETPKAFATARGAVAPTEEGKPAIVFENVTVLRRGQKRPLLDGLSFEARGGEILGFAGVGGNGLGVIEALLGGFIGPSSGRVLRGGEDTSRLGSRALRRRALAYVPADRVGVGSARGAGIDDNAIVAGRDRFARAGFLDFRAIAKFREELFSRYNIVGPGRRVAGASAASLSGGNLQKLILAREIEQMRDYIVFSEPTRGLDAASAAFAWGEISKLRDRGAAIALISTDLDEILALADRVIVMYRGRAAAEFRNDVGSAGAAGDKNDLKQKIGARMQGLD